MKKYETMFVLDANLDEATRVETVELLKTTLTNNGCNILDVNEWGNRELAYEINKQRRGYYVVCTYETENPLANAEFDRICGINSSVIRHIVIKLD
jgi:small subunit ribosomal protein S6